jgi:hypothetical protein
MTEPRYSLILQRLDHLRPQQRRWKPLGLVALGLLAVLAWHHSVASQSTTVLDELRTKAVVLVDKEDRPRLDLRVAANDSTHLILMDREGLVRVSLNVLAHGGADIVLRDQQGLPRAALSVMADGRPSLSLYDAAGTTRAALGLGTDGQSRVVLYQVDGTVSGMLPLSDLQR